MDPLEQEELQRRMRSLGGYSDENLSQAGLAHPMGGKALAHQANGASFFGSMDPNWAPREVQPGAEPVQPSVSPFPTATMPGVDPDGNWTNRFHRRPRRSLLDMLSE